MQGAGEGAFRRAAKGLDQLVPDQDQLGDHGHQVLEHVDVDANGLGRRLGIGGRSGYGFGLGFGRARQDGGCRVGTGFQRDQGVSHRVEDLTGLFGRQAWKRFGDGDREAIRRHASRLGDQAFAQGRLEAVEIDAGEMRTDARIGDKGADGGLAGRVQGRLSAETFEHRTGWGRRRGCSGLAREDGVKASDQGAVVALGLDAADGDPVDDQTHNIDGVEDGGNRLGRDRQCVVAEAAQHILGRMGHGLKAAEAQEARGPLDRVDQAEDVTQQGGIVRSLFEGDELGVEGFDALARLGHEILDDVVQRWMPLRSGRHGDRSRTQLIRAFG